MSSYLLIESRSSYVSNDVDNSFEVAAGLKKAGNSVTVFLIQNGVLPVRKAARHAGFLAAIKAGVTVCADKFSLDERAIPTSDVCDGIAVSDIAFVVDQLAAGTKTIWL